MRAADESYIPVIENSAKALRSIRCDRAERFLWINAISIDRSDDEEALRERARQVQPIYHIYAQATGDIIWLGAEADDSTYALDSLHRLGSSMHVDRTTSEIFTQRGKPTESMEAWPSVSEYLLEKDTVSEKDGCGTSGLCSH